jgi:hypothetical protein
MFEVCSRYVRAHSEAPGKNIRFIWLQNGLPEAIAYKALPKIRCGEISAARAGCVEPDNPT